MAAAHVDFVGSSPANVSTVQSPITDVVLEYSGDADPIRDEFRIEDAAGASVSIASVRNDGTTKVVVTAAEPLPTGRNKVTWALRGADGHKMSGTIAFTVSAAATAQSPSANPPPSLSASATPDGAVPATSADVVESVSSSPSTFEAVAALGRWIVYGAALFIVGAFAYLVWVHRGSRAEGRRIVFLIRRAAVLLVAGAIVEWFAQLAVYNSGGIGDLVSVAAWGEVVSSGFAIGTALRIIGAVLVLRFVALEVVAEDPVDISALDNLDLLSEFSPTTSGTTAVASRVPALARVRVESGPLAFLGVALLIASEAFIGHTASVQPRALVLLSDAAHLTAAGVWVSGVWLLGWTLWRRNRRGEPLDVRRLATRFSVLATWALVAVSLSGVALGWAILRSPSNLWTTEFGRVLLVKVSLVAVLGGIGLHNQRTVIPSLGTPSGDERFRRTIAVESGLFLGVLLLTALLVAASPGS